MTVHCAAEVLSAYLDAELDAEEARRVEDHVADCAACRHELEELGRVIGRLRDLERLSPPSVLGLEVQRRIALESGQQSLMDRVEEAFGRTSVQPTIPVTFALVFALAVIVFLFADAVERRRTATIPVFFEEEAAGLERPETGEAMRIAGRVLVADGAGWREAGVVGRPGRRVEVGSEGWRALTAEAPELAEIEVLAARVILEVGGEVVEISPEGGAPAMERGP